MTFHPLFQSSPVDEASPPSSAPERVEEAGTPTPPPVSSRALPDNSRQIAEWVEGISDDHAHKGNPCFHFHAAITKRPDVKQEARSLVAAVNSLKHPTYYERELADAVARLLEEAQ